MQALAAAHLGLGPGDHQQSLLLLDAACSSDKLLPPRSAVLSARQRHFPLGFGGDGLASLDNEARLQLAEVR